MGNINYPKFPCRSGAKNIQEKEKGNQCDLWKLSIHIK